MAIDLEGSDSMRRYGGVPLIEPLPSTAAMMYQPVECQHPDTSVFIEMDGLTTGIHAHLRIYEFSRSNTIEDIVTIRVIQKVDPSKTVDVNRFESKSRQAGVGCIVTRP